MNRLLIIIAHGSRVEAANQEFMAVVDTIDYAALGYDAIAGAFLEAASPSLEQAVAQLDTKQAPDNIDVYPLFFNKGRHVEKDLPALVASLSDIYRQTDCRLLPYFGAFPALGRTIAQHISGLS